ncbi:unnamed protein product [Didymodactylos carnosus]|uniref:Uncharacterized protein n=1 Tax=Didymodactylos carnosus TaxID=1234261 RepID=A0A8S2J063_9BILA|nr:unnamed protein product [Didymodactylos carnosus]CAF3780760.1 unnamed protein product [Didymodactylos carnosus]
MQKLVELGIVSPPAMPLNMLRLIYEANVGVSQMEADISTASINTISSSVNTDVSQSNSSTSPSVPFASTLTTGTPILATGCLLPATTISASATGSNDQIGAGFKDPFLNELRAPIERIRLLLKATKRLRTKQPRQRLPITFEILREICQRLRNGELFPDKFDSNSNLTASNVNLLANQQAVTVMLRTSKTDPL